MKSIRMRKLMKHYGISLFQGPMDYSNYKFMITVYHNSTDRQFSFATEKTNKQAIYKQVLLALKLTHCFKEELN